ncbi:hypothetical protein ACFLYE_03155 [Chloroflexota bacterium]
MMKKEKKNKKGQIKKPQLAIKQIKWILPTIAILGFIITIVFVIIPWASLIKSPIIVDPDEISFKEQSWQTSTSFYVQNRTGNTFSSVWIKVLIDDSVIKPNDILIDAKGEQYTPWEPLTNSNISLDFSFLRMDGLDSKGKPCIFFIIHHLLPRETQPFIIKIGTTTEINKQQNSRLLLSAVAHSKEPNRILKRGDETAYLFTPPETFTLDSISFKTLKK